MIHALLDTSVVIASAAELMLDRADTAAISVITVGELRAGVRLAANPEVRVAEQARLVAIREAFEPLPIDEAVADHSASSWRSLNLSVGAPRQRISSASPAPRPPAAPL
ncbi:MAG: hypothetical protein JO179_10110 [Solirubrobacterales bacterium]|nr:hypothetical protein [Solirubrobacterales bacterium]